MGDIDFSLLDNRAQVYDSFVQMESGGNMYKFESLQTSEPKFNWPNTDRISSDGRLFLTPQISKHTYSQRIVLTTSEVDTTVIPTNPETISWFIYQKELRNPVTATIAITYYAKKANKNMKLMFDYEVEGIDMPRMNEDGDVFVDTVGRIIPLSISFTRDAD